ncbi:DEXHc_RE domain containing protein [Candidatus Methylacidiphilaceae bacterium]
MPLHPKAPFFARNGFFQDLESFQELESRISNIQEDKEKGDAFEVFTEAYLATQRRQEAKIIWPAGTAPLELLQKTGLTTSDYGIDGLYQTTLGELNAYQVKYRSNRPSLNWRELSTFIGLADSPNIKNRVLITNCDDFPDLLNQRGNFFCIRGADLDRLDKDAFKEIAEWLKGAVFEKTRKTPKPHQQEAIDKILKEFSIADRATAVMACGTGKTLVGLWVMEALIPAKAIILMPSLALIRQTLHEWLRETNIKQFSFLCVCSDQSVSEGIDSLVINQSDLDFEVTTDPKRIRAYLDTPFDGTKVVFTTYHSAPVVGESLKPEEQFEYGVFDEAHKTTGKKDRRTGYALTNDNLSIRKRLFLTATPKRFNPLKKDLEGESIEIFSMDNEELYGKRCHTLSFGKAVAGGIICPYEVLISVITTEMVTNAMLDHGEVKVNEEHVTARNVANQIAVRDAVKKYGVKKIFTFHSTVKSAEIFTGESTSGIKTHLPECTAFHVNGAMPSNVRERLMKSFSESGLALMSNARCLTEGVDVPAVDMVAFLSPKKSQIDIIQAAGRAMRHAAGKESGYILVPLFLEQKKGESIASAVARADFLEVWEVLQSLQEQDDVLADIIMLYGLNSSSVQKAVTNAGHRRRIQILAPNIPLHDIEQSVIAKSLGKLTTGWSHRYAGLVDFYKEYMHCNVEYLDFRFKEHNELLKWLKRQRVLYKQGKLPSDRVQRLNELGIIWDYKPHKKDKKTKQWDKDFYSLTQHKRRHQNLTPNRGRVLEWTIRMRKALASNTLPEYQAKLLKCIGLQPAEDDGEWFKNYKRIQMWWNTNGNHHIMRADVDPSLLRWANDQRAGRSKGKLTEEQIQLLDKIEFPWKETASSKIYSHEDVWELDYDQLKNWWKARNNYFFSHMQAHLKEWAKEQCRKKREGTLTEKQINLLDQISFPWDRY